MGNGSFRNKSREGSCVLVHSLISSTPRQDLKAFNGNLIFEGSFIEIESFNLLVVSIYRIPGNNITKLF